MVAVGVLVADAPDLTQLHVLAAARIRVLLVRRRIRVVPWLSGRRLVRLSEILTRQQEHLLVKAADYRNLRLLRILRLSSCALCLLT